MINVRLQGSEKFVINDEIKAEVTKAENELNGSGRVLLRPSGTEPLVRVMVEGKDALLVNSVAKTLSASVERILAS